MKGGLHINMANVGRPRNKTKSKTIAVILAIIFGFWAWLYTYREDYVKFWIGLVASLAGFSLFYIPNFIVWISAIIDTIRKDNDFYYDYYKN